MIISLLTTGIKDYIAKPAIQGIIGATCGLTTIFITGVIYNNKTKDKKAKEIPLMSVRPVLKKIKKADEADRDSII